jgi:hypothetical protein
MNTYDTDEIRGDLMHGPDLPEVTQERTFNFSIPPKSTRASDPELWLYRGRSVAMLKTYFRYSIEVGRLPSILGRELFRARVTTYRISSFEDAVIFVHDVESALERLITLHQQLIAVIIFQDHTHEQAAELLNCARRTVSRELPEALDLMSEMFLEGELLKRLPTRPVEKTCQEGEEAHFSLSNCKQAE